MKFNEFKPQIVWFCVNRKCDEQEPWKAPVVVPCPSCKSTDDVTRAVSFRNLEDA